MTTLEEHKARIAKMKAAEQRVRDFVGAQRSPTAGAEGIRISDVALLLDRIDAYEASITWHTDCLTCPKLYDQVYEMDQHTIPALRSEITQAYAQGAENERARIVKMLRDEVAKDVTAKKTPGFAGAIVEGVMAVAKGTLLGFADRIEAGTI